MTLNNTHTVIPSAIEGWILDAYPSDPGRMTVWLITKKGQRVKLTDTFQPCIYVSAQQDDLEHLITRLYNNQKIASIRFVQKFVQATDIEKSRVLEITVKDCRQISLLTLEILKVGDYLRYEVNNCDIQNDRSYFFSHDLFPLAFVEVKLTKSGLHYTLLDSVESTDYVVPPLRIITVEVDVAKKGIVSNFDDEIDKIRVKQEDKEEILIDYGDEATKLLQLVYAVKELDPDIVLTSAGDSYQFPYLIHRAHINNVFEEFVLSRENKTFDRKSSRGNTYFSYGRTFYRAGTIRLYGRIHIDSNNTFILREADFGGLFEVARICRTPLHTAARFSIGSSMSSMQVYQAIKDDILVPRNKKIPETFKSAYELLVGDRGGFIYEPHVGIHDSVAELDFSAMYPALMLKYNISAETVLCKCCPDSTRRIPELNYHICTKRVGIVPKTIELALTKRLKYKRLRDETSDKHLKEAYDSRQTALKWVLVTCFGYLGFKNSKFGTVDGHIGVCAFGRDAFLKAKQIAEEHGFQVIHGIVDSLWLKKQDANRDDYKSLSQVITKKIGVPINFEGYYKWIIFLPSKMYPKIGVLNRYFGVMENGKNKIRGLETRRSDTPRFIFDAQVEMISILSSADNSAKLYDKIPEVLKLLRVYRQRLLNRQISVSDLIVTKHMSKHPKNYRQHVSQVIAAQQLNMQGIDTPAGNDIGFIFTNAEHKRYERRVKAMTLIEKGVNPDTKKYLGLLCDSTATLLGFAGYSTQKVYDAIRGQQQIALSDVIATKKEN